MFSEIHAESEALGLRRVLTEAIKSNDEKIIAFCKENVYPLYNSACGETYSASFVDNDEHRLIEKSFNPK